MSSAESSNPKPKPPHKAYGITNIKQYVPLMQFMFPAPQQPQQNWAAQFPGILGSRPQTAPQAHLQTEHPQQHPWNLFWTVDLPTSLPNMFNTMTLNDWGTDRGVMDMVATDHVHVSTGISVEDMMNHFQKMKTMGSSLEDIPELIHHIQLCLPVKEAARTSVLSKSWLHAWSTIPTLRFGEAVTSLTKEQEREHLKVVDATLTRYLRDNTPIESIDLMIDIENKESASLGEKWIRSVATKNCLTDLSLKIVVTSASFTLPDEILSGKNLTTIRVSSCFSEVHSVWMTSHPVINCVSLRELNLQHVHISEEVLDEIFSTCNLIVMIKLLYCKGFKTIKVKNLCYLNKLIIVSDEGNSIFLEINHVPNLSMCACELRFPTLPANPLPFNAHSLSLGSKVTHLYLRGLIIDDTCLDMIKSKFPSLNILSLDMRLWMLGRFDITCASLERLALFACQHRLIDVQVNAPKLRYFYFEGQSMPSFVFPAKVIPRLCQINLVLSLRYRVQASFFVKMRKAFELAEKSYIKIKIRKNSVIQPPFDIDIVDLRKRVKHPATNVHQLKFKTYVDEGLWERSPFFDALFSICHPIQVVARPDATFKQNNHFFKVMVSEVMEKKKTEMVGEYPHWPYYLKDFEMKTEQGETIPDSFRSSPDGFARDTVFKLNWG